MYCTQWRLVDGYRRHDTQKAALVRLKARYYRATLSNALSTYGGSSRFVTNAHLHCRINVVELLLGSTWELLRHLSEASRLSWHTRTIRSIDRHKKPRSFQSTAKFLLSNSLEIQALHSQSSSRLSWPTQARSYTVPGVMHRCQDMLGAFFALPMW